MEKTSICIIRHGETNWNAQGRLQGREDIELNDKGRQQAKQNASYFKCEHWDAIVSSPLKRAYETAQIIANELSIDKITVVDEIIERCYGSASGMLPDERKSKFPNGIPDQEEFETLRHRAMAGLEKIAALFVGKKVIVVAHGGVTNAILYTLSNGEFGSFKTRLQNGCLNMVHFQNKQWAVEYYNKTAEELLQTINIK